MPSSRFTQLDIKYSTAGREEATKIDSASDTTRRVIYDRFNVFLHVENIDGFPIQTGAHGKRVIHVLLEPRRQGLAPDHGFANRVRERPASAYFIIEESIVDEALCGQDACDTQIFPAANAITFGEVPMFFGTKDVGRFDHRFLNSGATAVKCAPIGTASPSVFNRPRYLRNVCSESIPADVRSSSLGNA